jgi:hypothetical protein
MSAASSAVAKVHSQASRIDAMLDGIVRREAEREAREDAARDRKAAEQARADSERCRQVQVKYADAFSAFGVLTPAPVEGERPGAYRQRLYEYLRKKLPSGHDLSTVRADDIPAGDAARNFERMMISAALAEGLKPSPENLPRDGSLIRRERTDDLGTRSIEWLGNESFIRGLNREGQRVLRFIDPKTQNVLHGLPFSRRG